MFGIKCSRLYCFLPQLLVAGSTGFSPSQAPCSQVSCTVTTTHRKADPPEEALVNFGKHNHLGVKIRHLFGGCSGALSSNLARVVFFPLGSQTVGQASTSDLGTVSFFLRALLPKHLLTVLCPCQCFLSSLVSMSTFIVQNFLLIIAVCMSLVTLPFGKNACSLIL